MIRKYTILLFACLYLYLCFSWWGEEWNPGHWNVFYKCMWTTIILWVTFLNHRKL